MKGEKINGNIDGFINWYFRIRCDILTSLEKYNKNHNRYSVTSHAVHLLILTIGEVKKGDVPLLKEKPGPYTDALPQALILTAIVISFAVTAFVLVLAYRAYAKNGTDDVEEMRGDELE